jgi:hypothetical protein
MSVTFSAYAQQHARNERHEDEKVVIYTLVDRIGTTHIQNTRTDRQLSSQKLLMPREVTVLL